MGGFLTGRTSLTTVQTADIADDAVTIAKMAAGTDGNVITYDTSGDPAVVATGTSGHFLKSAGAGAVPTFAADNKGAMTFISNTDISAAATYNFTAFTSGSYEHYVFILQNLVPATNSKHFWVRTSSDGGSSFDSGASDYMWGGTNGDTVNDFDVADAQISLTGDATGDSTSVGSAANESGVSGLIHLFGPHTTSYTHVQGSIT